MSGKQIELFSEPGREIDGLSADDVHDSLLFYRWIETFEASDDFLTRKLWNRSVATDGGSR